MIIQNFNRCFVSRGWSSVRRFSSTEAAKNGSFGLLLDIDGVIKRGSELLPGSKDAVQMLIDSKTGRFHVPTIFVTNAGNCMRAQKAEHLSNSLGVQISQDQVIMSHSPLRMFKEFHDKHVLVSGQGPVEEIARTLGFTHITTMDRLRSVFPKLDCVDHGRRRDAIPSVPEDEFPHIEAVILFGEPVRWETNLQLILDVLMTNGKPVGQISPRKVPYPHIPLLACNMDLLWLAEACLPRFGHGTFMLCLEMLYKKLAGHELTYTALMGKPSELTYHHAEYCIKEQSLRMGLPPPSTLYAIGDNPESDILGANLFNRFLMQRASTRSRQALKQHEASILLKQALIGSSATTNVDGESEPFSYDVDHIDCDDECLQDHGAERCYSILVHSGVFSPDAAGTTHKNGIFGASRHFGVLGDIMALKRADFATDDLLSAVNLIFDKENMRL